LAGLAYLRLRPKNPREVVLKESSAARSHAGFVGDASAILERLSVRGYVAPEVSCCCFAQ
jgi:hypothetical protein